MHLIIFITKLENLQFTPSLGDSDLCLNVILRYGLIRCFQWLGD